MRCLGKGFRNVSETASSFNGKPKPIEFRTYTSEQDSDTFGLPLNNNLKSVTYFGRAPKPIVDSSVFGQIQQSVTQLRQESVRDSQEFDRVNCRRVGALFHLHSATAAFSGSCDQVRLLHAFDQ